VLNRQVGRSPLERRLQKLELRLTDRIGLVRHTRAWLVFWLEELGKFLTIEGYKMPEFAPLEVVRIAMALSDGDDVEAEERHANYWERVERINAGEPVEQVVAEVEP